MNKLLLSCLLCLASTGLYGKTLHAERSLYRNIVVEEFPEKICMVFGRRSKTPDFQSCINPNNPDYLIFSYTKLVMAGLSIIPNPQSILIIGLGGGTLPMSYEKIYPDAQIDSVEIDSAVVKVAKQWFAYKESEQQKVHIIDGRVFVKRALRSNKKYDLIILDAFNGDYIPEHLMTQEFLNEIKEILNKEGLLIANTFSKNKLYHNESMTYQTVFGQFSYIHSNKSGNRLIYAQKNNNALLINDLSNTKLQTYLINIGVDFDDFNHRLTNRPDWRQNARPLSDQYAPANLLNQ